MKTLVYLIGGPGSGKSTLMAWLTRSAVRVPATQGLMRDILVHPHTGKVWAVELGTRRHRYSGTDAMSMTAIGPACDYLENQTETDLVYGEGARLGVRRFIETALEADYRVILGHLDHDQTLTWQAERAARYGRVQNPGWSAGRTTAARNLATSPPAGTRVVAGGPSTVGPQINAILNERHSQ